MPATVSEDALGAEFLAQGVVEIVAPDLESMLSFYCSLGFGIERRTGPFAVLAGFGVRIFVAENPNAPTTPRWTNLRIMVPNVDLIRRLAHDLGLPIVHDVANQFYGLRDFVLADPTGFEIRFAQVLQFLACRKASYLFLENKYERLAVQTSLLFLLGIPHIAAGISTPGMTPECT